MSISWRKLDGIQSVEMRSLVLRAAVSGRWMAWVLSLLTLSACFSFGTVEQGRVVAFDASAGLFTMVLDISPEAGKTDYAGLPAVTRHVPPDKDEIGQLPDPGQLLDVDTSAHTLKVYDLSTQSIVSIAYTPVDEQKGIGSKHALVYDAQARKAKPFPVLDEAKQTVTIYLPSRKLLLTIGLSPLDFQRPQTSWKLGDEVRIYLKQPPETLRLMNVSRTDIFSK